MRGVVEKHYATRPTRLSKWLDLSDESIGGQRAEYGESDVHDIDWFEVVGIRFSVGKKGAPTFQVEVRIGFRLVASPVENYLNIYQSAAAQVLRGRLDR